MPSRTPFFSVPDARKRKSAEKMPQQPPKSESFFVVKGLVFRTGSPYEEVVPQTGPKGLRSASRVGFWGHLGQKNGRISSNIWAEYGYSLSIQNSNKKMAGAPPCISYFRVCVSAGRVPASYKFNLFPDLLYKRSQTKQTHARLQISKKKWRAFRPVFLTFGCVSCPPK